MTRGRLGDRLRRYGLAILALALAGWQPFRTADPDVEAGNRAYDEGRYGDAIAAYDRARRRGGVDGDGLAFDRGTAELGQADAVSDPVEKRRLIEHALESLKQAARSKDPRIRGAASYNRGNALMAQDKLEDAIEAYKQALRDDPALDDARLNLELALRRREHKQRAQNQGGQGQPGQPGPGQRGQPGQGSPSPGPQGQPGSGQGQPGQGQGQPGQGQPGQGQPGQGQPGQAGGSSGGSNTGGGNTGSNAGPGQGSGSSAGGSNQASGSNDPGSGAGSDRSPPSRRPQRGRTAPRSPRTPADGKLDDLDGYSRLLQRDQARRRATGKPGDPQHDW
jgi:hypothetical protein